MRIFFILFLLLLGTSSLKADPSEQKYLNPRRLGHMAILHDGRIKPFDSFSRHMLLRFSGKESYRNLSALEWTALLLFNPAAVRDDRVFLVNHPETLEAGNIKLEKRRRYSFSELIQALPTLESLALKAQEKKDPKTLSLVERDIIRLTDNLLLYLTVAQALSSFQPSDSFRISLQDTLALLHFTSEKTTYSYMDIILRAPLLEKTSQNLIHADSSQWTALEQDVFRLMSSAYEWTSSSQGQIFRVIPVTQEHGIAWTTPLEATLSKEAQQDPSVQDELLFLADLVSAWSHKDQDLFDRAIISFNASIKKRYPHNRELKWISTEVIYHQINPFFLAKIFYAMALLTITIFFVKKAHLPPLPSGLLLATGFFFHTYGLITRIIILGRPPVSNLFETFLFVSWIIVMVGLIIKDKRGRRSVGQSIAAFSGTVLMFIASKFVTDGDTMKVLVAVLNSNFWLSTHVIAITIGYSGCCLAGLFAHVYLFQKAFDYGQEKASETFNSLFLALVWGLSFSFLGTVLGGVWADQSWGRFWGWDPKENGALMIVLWSAIAFHAKLAGIVRANGFALLTAIGIMVVVWAWFGVNLLSVGLHSYGFTEGTAINLMLFFFCEVALLVFLMLRIQRKESRGSTLS